MLSLVECYYINLIENNSDMDFKLRLQYEIISCLLNVARHSFTFRNPSSFERLTIIFLQCICNRLFKVLNNNSIGAHSGE